MFEAEAFHARLPEAQAKNDGGRSPTGPENLETRSSKAIEALERKILPVAAQRA